MSKGLDQIQPLAQDAEAWGDAPNLGAEFVAPETCHGLHKRIAELEREIYNAFYFVQQFDGARPNDVPLFTDTDTRIGAVVEKMITRIAALESERDAAQARSGAKSIALEELQTRLAEYEGENKRWHSFETVQAIVKERDELRAQLDAAKQSRNRVVWLACRYRALNRMNLAFFLDSENLLRDARIDRDAANAAKAQAEADARLLALRIIVVSRILSWDDDDPDLEIARKILEAK